MDLLGLVDVPWWAILIALIIACLSYACRDFNYFTKQGIPGYMPLPIFGTAYLLFRKTMVETALGELEMSKKKGCVGSFLGSMPNLSIYDDEMISEVMIKDFATFPNRLTVKGGSVEDYMLTNLKDHHWKNTRNEMTPTFTTGKLKRLNSEVNRCAKSLADALLEPAKKGEVVELKEYTGGYTMDVIASTAFGIRVDSQKDRNNAFVLNAKRAFDFKISNPIVLLRLSLPAFNDLLVKLGFPFNFIPKDAQEFFYDITRQAMEMRKKDTDQSRSDFLQLMLKAQAGENIKDQDDEDQKTNLPGKHSGMSTDEILANAMLFFAAGYDTTSTSLSFFMYNMALYPDCQAKLVEEIDRVVGDKDFVDYSFLQEMPYLEQCVNENLRVYPPAILVNRVATRDVTIKGIFIKKGLTVNIPVYGIHHDPARWPEPDKFDPERFSAENKKNRSPHHFLPFGNGPRNCIGMRLALQELKIAIIHVLKNISVSKCEKTQVPIKFANTGGLLKAADGIWVKVEQRNKK